MSKLTFISDLLDLKDGNLYLRIKGKLIPMSLDFYIEDDTFYFNVNTDDKIPAHSLNDLRTCLETEAENPCWSNDIYEAPMTKISNCEMKFQGYTITNINSTNIGIIVDLREDN